MRVQVRSGAQSQSDLQHSRVQRPEARSHGGFAVCRLLFAVRCSPFLMHTPPLACCCLRPAASTALPPLADSPARPRSRTTYSTVHSTHMIQHGHTTSATSLNATHWRKRLDTQSKSTGSHRSPAQTRRCRCCRARRPCCRSTVQCRSANALSSVVNRDLAASPSVGARRRLLLRLLRVRVRV